MFIFYFCINFDIMVANTQMIDPWNWGPKRLDLSHIMETS